MFDKAKQNNQKTLVFVWRDPVSLKKLTACGRQAE